MIMIRNNKKYYFISYFVIIFIYFILWNNIPNGKSIELISKTLNIVHSWYVSSITIKYYWFQFTYIYKIYDKKKTKNVIFLPKS